MSFKCPVVDCEDSEKEFQTEAALKSHIRNKHPEYVSEEEKARQVPIVEEDFATLLRKFKYKADLATNIAENISHTGGPNVFENPAKLLERLNLWSTEISAPKRRNIMDQWFAERNIDIPPEIQQKAEMTSEEIKKTEEKGKTGSGAKYVYDLELRHVRLAKEGEIGGTLDEAKEVKRLAEADEKEPGESPFTQDEDGAWRLNPKARISGMELMAYQFMLKSQEKGEPFEPFAAMAQAAEMMKTIREGIGGGSDGDSALKIQLEQMQKTIADLKDERFQNILENQQKQIETIANTLNKTIESIADVKKGQVGRTEMDIIHDIAEKGLELAKTELPGLRRDIKEAVGKVALPSRKTPDEREERKGQFREAIGKDRKIEEVGTRLFMNRG